MKRLLLSLLIPALAWGQSVTLDSEWDTVAEVEAAWGSQAAIGDGTTNGDIWVWDNDAGDWEVHTMSGDATIDKDGAITLTNPITVLDPNADVLIRYNNSNERLETVVDSTQRGVRTEFLPVGWMENGASQPAALETFDDTRKVDIRKFDSTTTEDLEFYYQIPSDATDADTGTAEWQLKYRVIAIITEATGPSSEGVSFNLQGVALADNEDIGAASLGTVSESDKASFTAAQNDIIYSDWAEITLTGAAAGEGAFFKLERDHDDTVDTYGQDLGVLGLEFKFTYASATY